ncbi:MAG TPA: hypothetical protein VFE50_21285 [Cyclobacteriaceae bacterium]|nr:hypothetical protein [Cyclobacteriaceae bacterium]
MRKKFLVLTFLVCTSLAASAQVTSIKGASSSNKGFGERGGGSGLGSIYGAYVFLDFAVRVLPAWQIKTLERRGDVPNILSLEVFGQVAVQPSTYYVFNPRVRGNWGLFFTDFRMNYMLEERIGHPDDLRTDDWQVLGLNVLNYRNVTARISTGFMHEAFGEGRIFQESVFGLSVMNNSQSIGGFGEIRWAQDHETGKMPRLEGSFNLQRRLIDKNKMHVFATGGMMFQRYYNDINVWGFQGGLAFKLY